MAPVLSHRVLCMKQHELIHAHLYSELSTCEDSELIHAHLYSELSTCEDSEYLYVCVISRTNCSRVSRKANTNSLTRTGLIFPAMPKISSQSC